ncbi:MAG TPA: PilX N-terminal domain-containing pilus assembly protein [Candidatus Limnocylindrales bacterium]|nr:PilX N-terminal domain-containing pilus assembly protein [Candidatus Limnocylindrales bacterium]
MRSRRETGMALATALLVLLLVSTMIVGLAWLVMTDQKLGGNNSDRQRAFYGAEGGMEALTAGIENAFNANPAVTCNSITGPGGVTANPPNQTDLPGIQFLNPDGTSGYQALFTCNAGVPASGFETITTGTYAGLYAQSTPYTLQVTARSSYGSEVKLQREIQTVAIPIFQFGMFSQTDLDFFAGPTFNFGGRVHTNGNLWLASGSTLTMSGKVTAAGELITANLENGWNTNNNYGGALNITNGSSFPNLLAQTTTQSVVGANNWVGNLGAINEPGFANVASGVYQSNIGVKETGVKPLNLAIATPGFGANGQSIDLIRRGLPTDAATFLQQRYFDMQGMGVRILLSDYGPDGTCATSDLSSTGGNQLPSLSANLAAPVATPVDLATLAWDPAVGVAPYKGANIPAFLGATGKLYTQIFPLPISGATGGVAYSATDGYWVKKGYPIITGCLKIDYQNNAGVWTDITPTILSLGYTGRNVNPQSKATMSVVANQSPKLLALPGGQVNSSGPTVNGAVATIGCTDPSPNAVIRFARERDNPSFANGVGGCPVPPAAAATNYGTDYWPDVIYDPREGLLRDNQGAIAASQVALAGGMHYVELDVNNLVKCLTQAATCPGVAGNVSNGTSTGYAIYFSDRRGERLDSNPPASVGGANVLTGGFGYDDIVNPASAFSCPNGAEDAGEDAEGDYNSSGIDLNPPAVPRTYGNTLAPPVGPVPTDLWPVPSTAPSGTQVTGAGNLTNLVNSVLTSNANCGGPGRKWPFAVANATELRENPPIFFRRALKLVNGSALAAAANPMGVCGAAPCGLTITSENPVYIQGDYNNNPNADPTLSTPNADNHVAASVVADAVTLLSDSWNDVNSFAFPYNQGNRTANVATTYRLAIAAGKNVPFKQPAVGTIGQDFGTDGGAHNFLRFIENWGPVTLYYRGSIVSMYYSHQAISAFKCCNLVYSPPNRGFNFDTDFQTPSKLPPLTPMLRDINTIGFTQMSLPTQ